MENDIREFRHSLRRVERELGLALEEETDCCGVTVSQCHLLLESECCPNASLTELSKALSLDKSTMSRTVDALHTAHYLHRAEDPGNRRKVAIQLTQKGLEKIASIHEICDESCRTLFSFIPESKLPLVLEAIPLLAQALEAKRTAAIQKSDEGTIHD